MEGGRKGLHARWLSGETPACTFLTTDFQEMITERKGEEYYYQQPHYTQVLSYCIVQREQAFSHNTELHVHNKL